jgi:hypothetical protein
LFYVKWWEIPHPLTPSPTCGIFETGVFSGWRGGVKKEG